MRFPCEYYLRYLLVGGRSRWAIADVQRHMLELGYPEPSAEYLRSILENLHESRPKPYLLGATPPTVWLKQQGLFALYQDGKNMSAATAFLEDSDARPGIEALLLSGIAKEHIAPILESLLGLSPEEETLSLYEHYYWNRNLLKEHEWIEFLQAYPGGKDLITCYTADPRYTMHFLGAEVTDMDMRGMIQKVARDAFFRIQEMRTGDASKVSRAYSDYSMVLMNANREMGGATTLSQLLEQVHAIGVKLQQKAVAKIEATGIEEAQVLDGTVMTGEVHDD